VCEVKTGKDLDAENPIPVTVGGITGRQLDVEVSSTPGDNRRYCGSTPCVPLWPIPGADPAQWLSLYPGYETRMFVLRVKGETVIISIGSRSRKQSRTPRRLRPCWILSNGESKRSPKSKREDIILRTQLSSFLPQHSTSWLRREDQRLPRFLASTMEKNS
jgi:hypothetical protein